MPIFGPRNSLCVPFQVYPLHNHTMDSRHLDPAPHTHTEPHQPRRDCLQKLELGQFEGFNPKKLEPHHFIEVSRGMARPFFGPYPAIAHGCGSCLQQAAFCIADSIDLSHS